MELRPDLPADCMPSSQFRCKQVVDAHIAGADMEMNSMAQQKDPAMKREDPSTIILIAVLEKADYPKAHKTEVAVILTKKWMTP